ncbi:MAG: adenylate/guanylate cyclase domain-containing protein [Fervidobacterium sp.]|uniref:Adenylate cyclase n=1 Tax=Fervidobacterium gondwanense DSM 13020 TaxID=1121883 RepID=A0A1M7RVK5_FERGO|nr:adenylate/guanylate cyclase domain-containing protein [Fervidobacterium gondwanense]UXF01938.1 adenylate cyclase [Fervidobacterium riparium]SHN50204.1 adenylate cyclase [Fervidobacterium gondwanense DSM 13020]
MKKIHILTIFLTVFMVWAIMFRLEFTNVPDLKIMDIFYKLRGEIRINPHVVIVGIDEYSLSTLEVEGDTWPWNREVYGRLLEKVFEDGAKVVAFDVSFTEPNEEEGDSYFASTLLMYGNVVLGTYLINEKQTYFLYNENLRKIIEENVSYLDYAYKMKNFKELALLKPFKVYKIRPIYEPFSVSAYSATYEIGSLDADGVVRRIPLLVIEEWAVENGVSSGILPHMNVIAAALYFGISPSDLLLDFSKKVIEMDSQKIPFDNSGYMHLWYYGKGPKIFKEVPFYDALNGKYEKGTFKDKVVLVGYTATAKGLYDLRITPFSSEEAGVYVHATAIENMISGDFVKSLTPFYNALLVVIIMVGITPLMRYRSKVFNTILVFLPVVYLTVSYVLFLRHIYVTTFYPILGLVVIGSTKVLGDFLAENAEKRRMREFLYRYVPDRVADNLLSSGELKLGGETKEVVVLFSDIKGFTSRSEKLSPEEVVSFLNVYLTKMSEIIRYKYDGTIDKFIGDAIMAIFGAPVSYENDIERALRCALDMRKGLKELNKEYGYNLDSGIGIHFGPAIVGNIGAPFRMDYTCIGDTVNTASRIEHLTRELDAEVIVSEEVMKRSKEFEFEYLGEYSVKGKSDKLKLYKLLGEKSTVQSEDKISASTEDKDV